MNRRHFLQNATLLGLSGMIAPQWSPLRPSANDLPKFQIRTLTSGPKHHFFGYYGMPPWNRSESKMVCLESAFHNRLPEPGETATIGLVDPESGTFSPLTETSAWNLQQGSLLHWNPLNAEEEVVYNDRTKEGFKAVILNVENGKKRFLDRPISAVAETGKYALSLNYGRLSRLRKTVGYADAEDPFADQAHPEEDGVFTIDLATGESKLIVSIKEVFERSVGRYPVLSRRHMWFNHTVFNPSAKRFLFLARTRDDDGNLDSAMFTANVDGSELEQVIPFNSAVSHFGWRRDQQIIATFRFPGEEERKHVFFADRIKNYQVIGEDFLIGDGHCTFSPDGKWLATDRKHYDSLSQSLWLWDHKNKEGMILCHYPMYQTKYLRGHTRCDFHPRWNRSSNKVCFDAIDSATRTRQLHLVELLRD